VRAQQGFFTIERTCPACQGMGRVIKDPCRTCGGAGRVRKDKTLQVTIPAGVEDGTRIRLAGEGEAGMRGAPPGDLYIFLSIAQHRIFQREGANIYCRVPITMTTAALGGTIEVPTIDGSMAKVQIPAGTQTGNQFRLRSKGMSVLRSPARGDMFIQAVVETPVNLTKRQQELLREFDEAGDNHGKHSPETHGFFAKVKDLWKDLTE
jgi:molecular chaperone DnaJ